MSSFLPGIGEPISSLPDGPAAGSEKALLKRRPAGTAGLFIANRMTVDRADQPAASFEQADGGLPRPDDFCFDGEAANLGMVERYDGPLAFQLMIMRKTDPRKGQILTDDRRDVFEEERAVVVEGN